nr:immunoglobulin heavy chain junction region [Macaca mulatta]MOV87844.1 immunoglobulin heavy chain junction region [Macaca mulatta]MOV88245.1 immunoglobulin heavy chain junction region [Macaca mulatta]MOV90710.1 immunoglobulin heavy chain junction region [Macaca mulatta]MOV90832.1 immunoglobulin heavy chain junction region [Macaca mulatta]
CARDSGVGATRDGNFDYW